MNSPRRSSGLSELPGTARNAKSNLTRPRLCRPSSTPEREPSPIDWPFADAPMTIDTRTLLFAVVLAAARATTLAETVLPWLAPPPPQPTGPSATHAHRRATSLAPRDPLTGRAYPPNLGCMPATPKRDWKRPTKRRLKAIRDRLRAAYGKPIERPHRAPVDELILTVLSQNTNDRNRDAAYARLTARFDSWDAVREAPVAEVEEAIRPGALAPTKAVRIQEILRALGDDDLSDLAHIPL